MSYLHSKNSFRRNRRNRTAIIGVIIILLCILIVVRSGILNPFSPFFQKLSAPLWVVKHNIDESGSRLSLITKSKKALSRENDVLREQVEIYRIQSLFNDVLIQENQELKDIFDRSGMREFILGAILVKPPQSLYDTFIIDIGKNNGISVGDKVFAHGDVLVGEIRKVYNTTSLAVLYSTAGEILNVIVGEGVVYEVMKGRGNANFEMILPRGIEIEEQSKVTFPGINVSLVGVVEKVVVDSRNPYQTLYIKSPINIQDLKWVQVAKQKSTD